MRRFREMPFSLLSPRLRNHIAFHETAAGDGRVETVDCVPPVAALVVAPHPDDEIIGAGGTAALHRAGGGEVATVILNDGSGGHPPGEPAEGLIERREAESRAAAREMGLPPPVFLRLPDRSAASERRALERLEQSIRELAPRLVYTPSPIDDHADHRFAAKVVLESIRSGMLDGEVEIACYDVWTPLAPTRVVDISRVADRKVRAMRCFESQTSYSNIAGAFLGRDRYRAARHFGAGATMAEGFCVVPASRFVRVSDGLVW